MIIVLEDFSLWMCFSYNTRGLYAIRLLFAFIMNFFLFIYFEQKKSIASYNPFI